MSKAASIFLEYLSRLEAGEPVDFESICRRNQTLADELRALRSSWEQLESIRRRTLPGGSVAERIRERHGGAADPEIELEPDEVEIADFSNEVLRRLTQHAGGFGRYRIRGEVARGGQGAVLRVWDEDLRRNLAMKVILGGGDGESGDAPAVDPKTLGRFLEEAQVTGQLDHPGIVPVHELGLDAEGRVYFTMKLVKGETLAEVFDKVHGGDEQWTMTRALGVLSKVCEAMSYAHAKQVVHRDLKPANVMVGRFGEVYVMDWGLARVLGRDDPKDIRIQAPSTSQSMVRSERREHAGDTPDSPLVTMDGDVVGTPAYMSPEQAKGQLGRVGPASDVYSLGAMLYHLLSGQMPYVPADGKLNNYAVWQRVQEGPCRPIADLAPGIAPELEAICEKAMARDVSERYASTEQLADDLRAYMEDRVVSAHGGGAWAELRKWTRRNTALSGALAAAVVLLVAGLLTALVLHGRAEANLALAQEREREARIYGDALTERAKMSARRVSLQRAWRYWEDGRVELAREVCPRTGPLASLFLRLMRVDSGPPLPAARVQNAKVVYDVEYSPDGELLAVVGATSFVELFRVDPFEAVARVDVSSSPVFTVGFDPTGARLAVGGEDGRVHEIDVSGARVLRSVDVARSTIKFVGYDRNDDLIVVSLEDIHSIGESIVEMTEEWRMEDDEFLCGALSHDRSTLAVGTGGGRVLLWPLDPFFGGARKVYQLNGNVLDLEFTARGLPSTEAESESWAYLVASGNVESQVSRISLEDLGSKDTLVEDVFPGSHSISVTAFADPSIDDWVVVSGGRDESVRLRGLWSGLELDLPLADGWVTAIAVHPESESLSVVSGDGGLRVFSLRPPD